MKKNTQKNNCPCGSGLLAEQCCLPFIDGVRPAPTAEALMRSRYTAYCLGNTDYLLSSWHASSRPAQLDADNEAQWIRLKIIASKDDHVEFIATYRIQGKAHKLHETSRFIYEKPYWYYVDGITHTS